MDKRGKERRRRPTEKVVLVGCNHLLSLSRNSFMPRELNDRLLMKTYYVVVEDVSFNSRAVNSLFRNSCSFRCIYAQIYLFPDNTYGRVNEFPFAEM